MDNYELQQLQDLYLELDAAEKLYKSQKLLFFKPVGQQREFFENQEHFVRMAVGSNRSGKSTIGVAEAAAHSIGERIWLPKDHPKRS